MELVELILGFASFASIAFLIISMFLLHKVKRHYILKYYKIDIDEYDII